MSAFAVGDVVEIVSVVHSRNAAWIGKQAVVSNVGYDARDNLGRPYYGIQTTPRPKPISPYRSDTAWHAHQLRKINPPDWQAPLATDTTLPTDLKVRA